MLIGGWWELLARSHCIIDILVLYGRMESRKALFWQCPIVNGLGAAGRNSCDFRSQGGYVCTNKKVV